MPTEQEIILLTDIPDWNAALIAVLERMGARVTVLTAPGKLPSDGILVNRVSAKSAAEDPDLADGMESLLMEQQRRGRTVINGARCYRLGYDKWAQAELFHRCGVNTPRTRLTIGNQRALPHLHVLLKPVVGSYGAGIVRLAPGEKAPPQRFAKKMRFIEQELLQPADGSIHRIEILGEEVLYDAATPVNAHSFNYCLASGNLPTTINRSPDPALTAQALRIAQEADMQIGSLEYLVGDTHDPYFIDLNPVSSFHPDARQQIGIDPVELLATWLWSRMAGK